jgi:hypothetical protein
MAKLSRTRYTLEFKLEALRLGLGRVDSITRLGALAGAE